ncbi:methyl-viologen-reducing hydrogenase delta subunit [Ammonifex degensii KC4]|uniref:Methyl-viologen-reducing hydrogenase delta subunit n=1 Tax=Ammonifex degensii (strain DSM 10501 / KC4) TaxID=429009 RepID=C9RD78_AMMDK|nr:FAD-dependent oxidoreductase [Ammonifex degensii]ACX52205.1 methyl-viologen-reducing hydrogenase delta subunit [Ammonifex degensii KC4]
MAKKVAVYLCSGCGLGEGLNLEALAKVATKEYKIEIVKTHSALCSAEGRQLIQEDIEKEGVDGVVIAGCSPRVNTEVFDFGPNVIVERVNLREQGIWCHPPGDEDTQMLAEDQLRMGIVKAKDAQVPEPYKVEDISKTILVIGGGLAGITAALEAAKANYPVVLVEKNEELGGWAARLYKQVTLKPPYNRLEEPDIKERIKAVEANPNIKVYTSAKVEKISGAPGLFDATISTKNGTVTERVGAIVLATGAVPYDASKLEHLGFGRFPNVITTDMLEEMARQGKIVRPSDGKEAKSVAFILCAGSRDPEHLPYCSASCCVDSLRQALYFKEKDPDTAVYIFYRDLRAPGQHEYLYKRVQEEGVIFFRSDNTQIEEGSNNRLVIRAKDVLANEDVIVEDVDLVVLATGMVPTTALGEMIVVGAEEEEEKGKKEEGPLVRPDIYFRCDLLNLEYRQGPELPTLKYGFPDSHFICFPYETRRTGIYAAGTVRAPMDMRTTIIDATGAALKAIQCLELTAQGMAVHPRSLDTSYPEFNLTQCTQCKRCTVECPFGALNEDEKANPLPNPTRCRRCATCMGACPQRAISFKNYNVNMIGNMVKAIEVPEEDEEKPRIVIFACENDAYPALDMAGIKRLNLSPWIRVIPLRCLGSMNLIWIADALAKGIDGVLLLGCKHGEDYQCHFVKGSELCNYRLSKIKETLDRLALESDRVRMVQVEIMDYHRLPEIIEDFAKRLEEVGPNPYKGF